MNVCIWGLFWSICSGSVRFCDAINGENWTILGSTSQPLNYIIPPLFSALLWLSFSSLKQRHGYSPVTTLSRAVKDFRDDFTATAHTWNSKVFPERSIPLYASAISWNGTWSFFVNGFYLKCCSRSCSCISFNPFRKLDTVFSMKYLALCRAFRVKKFENISPFKSHSEP